jgi:hypothetical protein
VKILIRVIGKHYLFKAGVKIEGKVGKAVRGNDECEM